MHTNIYIFYSTYNSFCLQDLRSDPLKTHNKIYQLPMF